MSRVASAAATVPQPCRVLGTSLRPFCLGHHLLFRRLKLPFTGDAKAEAAREEIAVGIAVCAAGYEETLAAILDGTWLGVVARWRKKVAGPWYWPNRVDWARTERLFRNHLSRGYEEPPVWKYKNSGGITLTAPGEILLKTRLVMAGFSESEVLNGYLPARWYDYFTVAEIQQAEKLEDRKKWNPVFVTPKIGEALKGTQR